GGVPLAAVRAGHARPGPDHPHERRAAAVQLPAVAVRVLGAALHRGAVARLLARGLRGRARRVRGAPAPVRRPMSTRRRSVAADLSARIMVAIPAVAYAIFIIAYGGWVFAVGILVLGFVCLHELFRMYESVRPIRLAAFAVIAGLAVAAEQGAERQ